jgi:hypothetical protein
MSPTSWFGRGVEAVKWGWSSVKSAARRGLSSLGIDSLLQNVGLSHTQTTLQNQQLQLAQQPQDVETVTRQAELINQLSNLDERRTQLLAEIQQIIVEERRIEGPLSSPVFGTDSGNPFVDMQYRFRENQRNQYAYIVDGLLKDKTTGEITQGTVTVSSRTVLGEPEILAIARRYFTNSPRDILSMQLVDAYSRQ